jgi:hypothetical protein
VDRRLGGVLVLVLALVATLAGNARTKQLAGDPVRGPLPDPPAVGDCVLEPLSQQVLNAFGSTQPARDYPTPRTAPCTGTRYGEIVAVLAAGLDYVAPATGDAWSDTNSPANRCSSAAEMYLGVRDVDHPSARWSPTAAIAVGAVGPGPVLSGAGQRWLACVVLAFGDSAASENTKRFTGTLRAALASLRLPPQLAQCVPVLPDPSAWEESIPCARPHRAELLGFAWSDQPDDVVKRRLTGECPELASKLTGLADPSGHGRLRVRVTSVQLPPDASGTDPDGVGPVNYYCGIEATGGHVLTGPLLGLGEGPLPIH